MQAYTHIMVGALCGHLAARGRRPRAAVAAFCVAALSHPFLDIASQLTYHPVDGSRLMTNAWLIYHLFAYSLALVFAVRFRQHVWFWLAALWPDLDWVLRDIHAPWPEGLLHALLLRTPWLGALADAATRHLPDVRGHWVAGLPEMAVAVAAALWLARADQAAGARRPHKERVPSARTSGPISGPAL